MKLNWKKIRKRSIRVILIGFVLMNLIAIFHSYKFTHFSSDVEVKTKDPTQLSFGDKISTLFFGINNPRPITDNLPVAEYETVKLQSNVTIECWKIEVPNSKGTVALFHGYSGEKSSMLDKSRVFNSMGYSTFLVDFMGSGGSEGNKTTIGFDEAQQVTTVYNYLKETNNNIQLFGTSMGAVAIMKSISDDKIKPDGIILECPFGSMYNTVGARFENMNVPKFPMVGLLVFWGGAQNGFWAFGHNPTEYAKEINCKTLLMYGEKDDKVSKSEIDEIYENLNGEKTLKLYPEAGHENYLNTYSDDWKTDIEAFLNN